MMKKQLIVILILFLSAGCSTNDDFKSETGLLGTWERSMEVSSEDIEDLEEGEYFYINRIEFSSDNSYKELFYLARGESREVIGYFSKQEGTFSISGMRLQLNYNTWSSNEEFNMQFVPLEDLVLIDEDLEHSFNYSFSGNRTILVFDFDPCGPLENCVDKIEYQKVK